MIYDCIVIGGGVVGTSLFDRLSQYDLKVLLLEKNDDVASGASRANSGVVHAGYDCKPNTLKAKFNVLGNKLIWRDAQELNVPFVKCGSIVVGDKDSYSTLNELKAKGDSNGVNTVILDRVETLKIEPNISDTIEYSLYAPESGVVCPYKLVIGYADRGILNGGEVLLENEVVGIKRIEDLFEVKTNKSKFYSKIVVNCAGAFGAVVNDLAGAEHFDTQYRKGDYLVLDKLERRNINTVIFPTPTILGKGILVAPTADGNVIYGPTAIDTDVPDPSSSYESIETIKNNIPLTYKNPAFNKCIRVYTGVRTIIGNDFIVKESDIVNNYFMAVGICSPGLTSAPAISEYLLSLIIKKLNAIKKDNLIIQMEKKHKFSEMSYEEINELSITNKQWDTVICRCEKITEAEIVEAIHSPLIAKTVDAVKRRTRAGMGRCQGGFCGSKVMEIISRELSIPINKIRKGNGENSNIAMYKIMEVEND